MATQRHEYRSIVFLCGDCGGDLVHYREFTNGEHIWRCTTCQQFWMYGDAGWVNVEEEK